MSARRRTARPARARSGKGLKADRFAPLLYVVDGERDGALHALAASVAGLLDGANRVCFKLEQQQILLASQRSAFVGEATTELDDAVRDFSAAEAGFRATLSAAAAALGAPLESTLRELALCVGEPWGYILTEGAAELRSVLAAIEAHKASLRELLTRSHAAVTAALEILGVATPTAYDASGALAPGAARSVLFNQRV